MKIIKQRQLGGCGYIAEKVLANSFKPGIEDIPLIKARGLNCGGGLLQQMREATPTVNYDKFTIKNVEDALRQMSEGRVGNSRPTLILSDLQYRYYNATINNDEVELKVLNAEMFDNWIRTTQEMSERYKLDYDLVYLLRKKYRWWGDSFEVSYKNTSDIDNEYDDSYEYTKLHLVEDKFILKSYESDGWSSDLVKEEEIKKEDLFNKLIINDYII